MTDIVLYGIGVSAFVAKVRIALDLKGLAYSEVPPPGGYGSQDYRAIIASGSVPGLTHGGLALGDSNAILEYIEETWPDPPLMPADRQGRARVRALLGFHDGRVEAAARGLFPLIKGARDPAVITAALGAVTAALERLEELLPEVPGPLTLADCAWPVTLQMIELMAEELGQPVTLPPKAQHLARRLAPIPAFARSLSIAATAMEDWMAPFRR